MERVGKGDGRSKGRKKKKKARKENLSVARGMQLAHPRARTHFWA